MGYPARFSSDLYGDDPLHEYTNYAFSQCGAKVVDSSSESIGLEAILTDNRDTYMQSPCTKNRHFVIRLCDYIKIKRIVIDNHEYFSSKFKEFEVYVAEKYTTGLIDAKWHLMGSFVGKNLLGQQIFEVKEERWAKFVKIKFISHYGQYKLCPLNFVAILGTNMLEEAKKYTERQTQLTQVNKDASSDAILPSFRGPKELEAAIDDEDNYDWDYMGKGEDLPREQICKTFANYLSGINYDSEYISQIGLTMTGKIVRETLKNCLYFDPMNSNGTSRTSKNRQYLDGLWFDLLEDQKKPYEAEGHFNNTSSKLKTKSDHTISINEKDVSTHSIPDLQKDPGNSNVFEDIMQMISKLEHSIYKINIDMKKLTNKTYASILEHSKIHNKDSAEFNNTVKNIIYTQNEMVGGMSWN